MISCGVVGVGALGEHHARHLASLEGVRLVGVADIREDRAAEIGRRLGVPAYSDYQKLIGRVEAVCVAVPTRLHAEVAGAFLRRGIHTLVEKPMADSLEAADAILDAASAGGALLQVGHSERFNPALKAVQPHVSDPRFFEAHRLGVFVPRSLDIDVVLDLMIHDLDIIRWLVRSPLRDVRAVGIPILSANIDIANARLEFESGCVANVTASRVSTEKVRKLRLFQPHDYVSIDFSEQSVAFYSLVEAGGGRRIVNRAPVVGRDEPLRAELESFARAIAARTAPECSGEEGRASLDLALQVLQAMKR